MFPSIYDKASVLATRIINNHPFVDGNKRTGLHAMLVFFALNEIKILINNADLVKLGNNIAKKIVTTKDVSKLLEKNNTSQHPAR